MMSHIDLYAQKKYIHNDVGIYHARYRARYICSRTHHGCR
jgi:hypothetical protein